jgi:hypothetical protein
MFKLRHALLASSLLAGLAFSAWYEHRAAQAPVPTAYRRIRWPDLVPKDWDQFKRLREFKVGSLRDGDPQARQLLMDMRVAWDAAPTVESMDGEAVQIFGYVVPLEADARGLTELLLVPYEGACIHTPPPPANQVVHVVLARPVKGLRMMDNVSVRGVINAHRETTFRAVSGYDISEATTQEFGASAMRQ